MHEIPNNFFFAKSEDVRFHLNSLIDKSHWILWESARSVEYFFDQKSFERQILSFMHNTTFLFLAHALITFFICFRERIFGHFKCLFMQKLTQIANSSLFLVFISSLFDNNKFNFIAISSQMTYDNCYFLKIQSETKWKIANCFVFSSLFIHILLLFISIGFALIDAAYIHIHRIVVIKTEIDFFFFAFLIVDIVLN